MFDSWPGGSWEATVKYVVAVLAIYLAAIWVALFAWQHGNEQRERLRILERRLTELGERTENLEDERRARRALPPL